MAFLTRNTVIASGVSVLVVGVAIVTMTSLNGGSNGPARPIQAQAPAPAPPQQAAAPSGPVPYAALQALQPAPTTNAASADPYAMLPPPPVDSAQDPTVWPTGVAAERFSTFVSPFTFVRDSAAYAAASGDAPQLYPLRAGTAVASVEKSTDGKWIIAMTEDGKAAYLLASDLGPYDPSKQPQADLPAVVSGPAQVVDTAMLDINGQRVKLTGIRGESGIFATQLQKLINADGPEVTCALHDTAYRCSLPNGLDIARSALFNGAAEPADDATDDYRAQAESAKQAHRGVWN